jgi:CubicO group peptidase (beta-lactamase class C family)
VVAAYHVLSYGFILGELVQRVTGRPVEQVMREELLEPLGLRDLYLGLPDHALARAVPVRAGNLSELGNQIQSNRRRVRQAVIPAAGISTTAAQLARFYHMLMRGGELDSVRVLQEASIMEARRPSSDGAIDAFIKRPVRWAQGFHLGGPGGNPRSVACVMGMASSPLAFGHAGNASCVSWADPGRRLVLAYLSNIQPSMDRGIKQLGEISDAVLASF